MMRMRLCFALTAVLALLLATAAVADTTSVQWQDSEWDCSQNTIHPGVPILIRSIDWDATWDINGDHLYALYGAAPDPNDPDVSQTIRNRTQTPWTDWHVRITNGFYRANTAVVYNLSAASPIWDIVPDGDGQGFFAHVVSGQNTQVDYSEMLSVFFSYDVNDPIQQVSITQYPTNTWAIPEPGSILGLISGLLALGFGIRRRA